MEALAIKYRPKTFKDVCSQDSIKSILLQQLKDNSFKNVYLFCGPAGCGKTTCARIFAHMINQNKGHPIEVDAASNSGVDNVRTIIEDAKKRSLDSEYKVYIIDECHMLSTSAWNALLKLLEEPPKYTIFILCTTDPQKIIETILSRVQRYDFTKIPYNTIVNRLRYICEMENISYNEEALDYIAKLSNGGMRDAISKLDKVQSSNTGVFLDNVVDSLGVVDYDDMFSFLTFYCQEDIKSLIQLIETIYNSGKDLKNFIKDLLVFMVECAKYKVFNDFKYLTIPNYKNYKEILNKVNVEDIFYLMDLLRDINNDIKYMTDVKYVIESVFLGDLK